MKNLFKKTKSKTINFLYLLSIMLVFSLVQVKIVNANNRADTSEIEEKIINGDRSGEDDWPWMAHIIMTDKTGSRFACGGTLVDPEWVLTAAHCAEDFVAMDILLGQNNLQGTGGENISVDEIIIHPDFDSERLYADIALLHLERPSSLEPAALSSNFDFQNEIGNTALAIGWGITSQSDFFGDTRTSKLQEVELTLKRNDTCDEPNLKPDNVICLGVFDKKSTCKGDSGGPLIIFNSTNQRWEQIGITSFGLKEGCISPIGISVFTQVDKYMQFIDSTISSTENALDEESPEEFLAKCVKKFPQYLGKRDGDAFACGNSEVCQNTTGGELRDIRQISVLKDNKDEVLEFLDMGTRQWYKISFSDIGYCE